MLPITRIVYLALACFALVAGSTAASARDVVPTCFDRPATIVGTIGDDDLHGTEGDDVIVGLDGIDVIHGGAGNDLICAGPNPSKAVPKAGVVGDVALGEAGDDVIAGGPGLDLVNGGPGNDVLFTDDAAGTDSPVSVPPSEARVTCQEFGNGVESPGNPGFQSAVGSLGDDIVIGGRDHEQLWGDDPTDFSYLPPRRATSGGSDVIRAGPGDDCIRGGPGDDLIDAGSGADVLLGGAGVDRLLGRSGNDELRGNTGADLLLAGTGSDRNFGGRGRDLCRSPSRGVHAHSCERR